ncbi:hypothetical protein [Bradyrhizobium sp. STM 3562]|uniref:hypothetical protein n=1 Tax=Bradyrhizobium sp. STM 3562 TaxID=578924 RepID=UPI003890398E
MHRFSGHSVEQLATHLGVSVPSASSGPDTGRDDYSGENRTVKARGPRDLRNSSVKKDRKRQFRPS